MRKGILLVLIALQCTSCSVVMAARKEGTTVVKIQQCKTRNEILAQGAEVMSSEKNDSGELVETCKFKKERGSTARAAMHGVLDIATTGLWEFVGTPIEGSITDEFFCLKIIYNSDDSIKKVSLN